MIRLKLTYILFGTITLLAGCSPDDPWQRGTVEAYVPVYSTDPSTKQVQSLPARPVVNGGKLYNAGTNVLLEEKDSGLHIISYTNPVRPQRTGFIRIPGMGQVTIEGNYLYAANYNDIVIIDLAAIEVRGRINGVVTAKAFPPVDNAYFECADPSKGPVIGWRKTLVNNPQCRTSRYGNIYGENENNLNAGIVVLQQHLYLAKDRNLLVYSMAQPSSPVLKKSLPFPYTPDSIFRFNDDLAVTANIYSGGMDLYSLAEPEAPVLKKYYQDITACLKIRAAGQNAFAINKIKSGCSWVSGLNIYDMAKDSPFLSSIPIQAPGSMALVDRTVYVSGFSGTEIINVTDVTSPVIISGQLSEIFSDMQTTGNLLFARTDSTTWCYNITLPQAPVLISKLADR